MKILARLAALVIGLCAVTHAYAAATLLPQPEQCFAATTPTSGGASGTGTGFIGTLGTITPGSGGKSGTYFVNLTGGSGSNASANITVSGGGVTQVQIYNPGIGFAVGNVLTAPSATIGGVVGFFVPVNTVSINNALAGGQVYTYVPGSSTPKTTWFNADQASNHQNSNPILLDVNGCAIIYGAGSYRFVVQDSLGNTVYDQVTADTSASNSTFWAGLAGGTANAITVTDAGFNGADGSVINFLPLHTNTGAATLNPSSYFVSAPAILQPTASGPAALTSSCIVTNSPTGNAISVVWSNTAQAFLLLTPCPPSSSAATIVPVPQGYLTLSSDVNNVVITTDTTAATTVYYTPYNGNQIPIYNGTNFVNETFSQLSLALTSSFSSDAAYDVCVFLNGGVPTLVGSVAWSNSSGGSSARGTAAAIQRVGGIWVNSAQITGTNGATTYTIPAQQCTIVGSILIDGTAGQVSDYLSWGQSRKWATWNFYNRLPIVLQAGDSTASWTYATATVRASNNASANSITAFTGLAEEPINAQFVQFIKTAGSGSATIYIGIGLNSTTAFSGTQGVLFGSFNGGNLGVADSAVANYVAAPSLGTNVLDCLEEGNAANTNTFNGGQGNMVLTVEYRG